MALTVRAPGRARRALRLSGDQAALGELPQLAGQHRARASHATRSRAATPPRRRAARAGRTRPRARPSPCGRSGGARLPRRAAAHRLGARAQPRSPRRASPRRMVAAHPALVAVLTDRAAAPGTGAARPPSRGCPRWRAPRRAPRPGSCALSSRSRAERLQRRVRLEVDPEPLRVETGAARLLDQRLRPVQLPAPAHEALAQDAQVALLRLARPARPRPSPRCTPGSSSAARRPPRCADRRACRTRPSARASSSRAPGDPRTRGRGRPSRR